MAHKFSKNLLKYREQKHLSQERLANKINVSKHTISNYECGTSIPSLETAYKIAEALGVTLNDLVY